MTDTLVTPSFVGTAEPAADRVRARFAPLLAQIAEGAVRREREGELPFDAVRRLAEAGVGAVRLPVEHGGDGLDLVGLTALWIDLAAADANLAQALRGHGALVEDRLWQHACGADQTTWFGRLAAGELVGNAWSEVGTTPQDSQKTTITRDGEAWRLDGAKYYTTGTIYADWADVYVRVAGTGRTTGEGAQYAIALVRTDQPGVVVSDDWDGFGQRGTGSGTALFSGAVVDDADVLPFGQRFGYQTALYQLNLLATLVGIGRAALDDTVREVRARDRNYSHANAARVRDDAQVLARVGEIAARVYAAEAATLRVGEAMQRAADSHALDAEAQQAAFEAAEVESSVAQVVVTQLVLDATTDLFDTLGASATSREKALDRHWRNARTVSSHNPRILKARVVGDSLVNGTAPPYAWAIGRTERTDTA
ncbi:acyl-CoA dehydrogenase family protein [Nocardioides sp. CFH 31398]|uniref:acyl-CoA dehydrogenase family protein n=1 Tax=Nocardioides sp. CFH 31398 TaxID=2919579 RepID=UPI001F064C9E|nr:acyl-CoA dehydrogenase family protein [Nocardioides sp. CFH 31398]MCH1867640.1 acyl-CoA dehydrogenase family protein [Nocardioides sp. CFH 31398]